MSEGKIDKRMLEYVGISSNAINLLTLFVLGTGEPYKPSLGVGGWQSDKRCRYGSDGKEKWA